LDPGRNFPAGSGSLYAYEVTTDAAGAFLYVAKTVPSGVAVFSVEGQGNLTEVPGPFYTADPNNGFLHSPAVYPGKSCGKS